MYFQFFPFSTLPTPTNSVIRPKDVLLLNYAYTTPWTSWTWLTPHLFQKFAAIYGAAIQSLSLRHAMLAFIAGILPPDLFNNRAIYHQGESIKELVKQFENNCIDDGDLFAAYLLTYLQTPGSREECIHGKGCIQIWSHLFKKDGGRTPLFDIYGRFAADRVQTWLFIAALGSNELSLPSPMICRTIEQRASIYFGFEMIPGSPPAKIIAAGDDLWDWAIQLTRCIVIVAERQSYSVLIQDEKVNNAVNGIKQCYYERSMQIFLDDVSK